MRYEIDKETFAVNVYDGINPEPFWFQPNYPNGDSFDSLEEAEAWAKLAVKSHDPEYGFFAPNGKGLEGEPKPTEAQLLEAKLARIGLTADELKTILGL
jgi:hypothetical protein